MTSPYRPADRLRSSPSGHRAPRSNRNSRHEAQSSQLMEDLSRLLTDSDRTFKKQLDQDALQQQQLHVEALERALKQHEAVRKSAEHTYETFQLELERQRIAREAEQARRLAEERRKLEAAKEAEVKRVEEARQREVARRKDQERQQQEALQKQQQEEAARDEARRKAEEARHAAEQRAREVEAAKQETTRQEAETRQRQQQQQETERRQQQAAQVSNGQRRTTPAGPTQHLSANVPPGLGTTQEERLQVHNAYLKLHAQCKELRREILQVKNVDRQMYDSIKDHARHIKLAVGQLAKNDRDGNRKRMTTIIDHWKWSIGCCPSETADINLYRLQPVQSLPVPKVFLYMVNYTVKIIVKQLAYEVTVDPEFAEPIGVLTATLFSKPEFKPNGHFMSDMLWAKFHKAHATIFGVQFDELTPEGRLALGYRPEMYSTKTMWHDAVRAMSRGYAAITLRDFTKSQNENPFPNRLYWEALSRILTTPMEQRMALHYVTAEGMLDPLFAPRFIKFYGNNALAAIRLGILVFPQEPDKAGHELQKSTLRKMHVKFSEQLNLRL